MSAPITQATDAYRRPAIRSCRNTAAHALTIVRDGVITGEGPTTKGRIHFSRSLDADDAAWCARILTASAVEHQPISRAEAERCSRSTKPPPSAATVAVSTTCWPRRSPIMRPPRPACRCRRARWRCRRIPRSRAGRRPGAINVDTLRAGVDRRPDARQAPQQPHADGDGRDARRRRALPLASCRTCSTSG